MQSSSYTCSHSSRDQYLNQMSDRLISLEDGIGFVSAASVGERSEKWRPGINRWRKSRHEDKTGNA